MTIAAETRELDPGRPREREFRGGETRKVGYEREEISEEKRERRIEREEGRKCEREEEGERSKPSFAAKSARSFRSTPQ